MEYTVRPKLLQDAEASINLKGLSSELIYEATQVATLKRANAHRMSIIKEI